MQPSVLRSQAEINRAESIVQAIILVILFAVPAIFWARTNGIHDPDIWWHLRTGQWIVQHRAVPHTDSFSSFATGKPWQAYSWLFEVIVYKFYAALGLTGIILYIGLMVVAITAALHHMVKRLQRDFSLAIMLTAVGAICLGHLYTPRPWLFTILFFVFELDILMHVRRTGRLRELLWLPVIFALWANIHIQFIDGLVVLAIAAAESLLPKFVPSLAPTDNPRIHPLAIPAAFLACIVATFLNPYGPYLYRVAYDLNAQSGVLNIINELKAVPFRDLADFIMLMLALASCAMLARARRVMPFELALFVFAAFVSFRSQRDVWVMGAAAVAILASQLKGSEKAHDHTTHTTGALAVVAASLAVLVSFSITHVDNQTLRTQVIITQPVLAVDFIKQHKFQGPLYNDFNWGGYLIWNLPNMPASIDGRTTLMGQDHIDKSMATMGAHEGWAQDPELTAAGIILLPVDSPLSAVLRMDSRFRLVYQDKLALVFLGRQPSGQSPLIIETNPNPSAVPLSHPTSLTPATHYKLASAKLPSTPLGSPCQAASCLTWE